MTLVLEHAGARLFHATWRALAERVQHVDALITDPPYSEHTHRGHDAGGPALAERAPRKANGVRDTGQPRRPITYAPWSDRDVAAFVSTWAGLVRGWWFVMTDDELAPAWKRELRAIDLVVFPILPCIMRGSGVRLAGDGPSSVTRFAVVARPRSRFYGRWGTLPGYYECGREPMPVVGGKTVELMDKVVRDYSRAGQLVCDPCCGGGTTLLSASKLGRRSIGGDQDLETVQIAAKRLREAA